MVFTLLRNLQAEVFCSNNRRKLLLKISIFCSLCVYFIYKICVWTSYFDWCWCNVMHFPCYALEHMEIAVACRLRCWSNISYWTSCWVHDYIDLKLTQSEMYAWLTHFGLQRWCSIYTRRILQLVIIVCVTAVVTWEIMWGSEQKNVSNVQKRFARKHKNIRIEYYINQSSTWTCDVG